MKTMIEPTIKVENKNRVIEAIIPAACLKDIQIKYELSSDLLIKILDKYFSQFELEAIEEFVAREIDADVMNEAIDTSTNTLLDKVPANEIKNMVKDAGVELSGKESDDELKGMVKALATEAPISPDSIGGYEVIMHLKATKPTDHFADHDHIDATADTIVKLIDDCQEGDLDGLVVDNIRLMGVPKSLFEVKAVKLSKFLR